jgi:hypothetical protein
MIMQTKEMLSRLFRTLWNFPGKIFFFVIVLSFSIVHPGQSASAIPVRTEIHEKAAPRVSKPTSHFHQANRHYKSYFIPDFRPFLKLTEIRIIHQLRIFPKRNFHLNLHHGLHLRLPQAVDEPSGTA